MARRRIHPDRTGGVPLIDPFDAALVEHQPAHEQFLQGTWTEPVLRHYAAWFRAMVGPSSRLLGLTAAQDQQGGWYLRADLLAVDGARYVGECYTLGAFYQLLTSAFAADSKLVEARFDPL